MFFHKSYCVRLGYSVPVLTVICLTSFVFYCYHAGYMWLGEGSLISDASVYILLVLLSWSYFAAILTDPGTIPQNYAGIPGSKEWEVTMCKFCDSARPPRTHHCRVCDRCVLRQDHHCPWIGNCVGFHNHRYFIQFVVYATLDTGLVGSSCAGFFLRSENYNGFTLAGAFLGMMLSVAIGGIAVFHIWGMFSNKTTGEFKRNFEGKHFETGDWHSNLAQVFGNQFLSYFFAIPTKGNLDGINYPAVTEENPQEDSDIYVESSN